MSRRSYTRNNETTIKKTRNTRTYSTCITVHLRHEQVNIYRNRKKRICMNQGKKRKKNHNSSIGAATAAAWVGAGTCPRPGGTAKLLVPNHSQLCSCNCCSSRIPGMVMVVDSSAHVGDVVSKTGENKWERSKMGGKGSKTGSGWKTAVGWLKYGRKNILLSWKMSRCHQK